MITINLTEDMAHLLTDVIDLHVQGIAESKELTEVDPTVTSAEQLLELMAGYDDDMATLKRIRFLLNPPKPVPRTQEEKIAFRRAWDADHEKGQRRDSGT